MHLSSLRHFCRVLLKAQILIKDKYVHKLEAMMQHRETLSVDDFIMWKIPQTFPSRKKTRLTELSNEALSQPWNLVARKPEKLLYQHQNPDFTVYRFDDLHVVTGKIIGQGLGHRCTWYAIRKKCQYTRQPLRAKKTEGKNIFGRWLDRTLNTNEKLIEERIQNTYQSKQCACHRYGWN